MLSRIAARRATLGDQRGLASMEFALIAPILLTLTIGTVDGARALLIWRQVHNAANAIAENAEKLSVTTDPNSGLIESELTNDQMQQAMSTIYAEIPGLNLGNGSGLFPGNFAVTLSSVAFLPICTAATGCATQTPNTLWSSTLVVGGPQLLKNQFYRPCAPLLSVANWIDNPAQYYVVPNPNLASGATAMTVPSQLVVDVQYTFKPYFPLFLKSTTFYASATTASPVGGLDAETTLNTSNGTANVNACP